MASASLLNSNSLTLQKWKPPITSHCSSHWGGCNGEDTRASPGYIKLVGSLEMLTIWWSQFIFFQFLNYESPLMRGRRTGRFYCNVHPQWRNTLDHAAHPRGSHSVTQGERSFAYEPSQRWISPQNQHPAKVMVTSDHTTTPGYPWERQSKDGPQNSDTWGRVLRTKPTPHQNPRRVSEGCWMTLFLIQHCSLKGPCLGGESE